jgi:hypothetical protein
VTAVAEPPRPSIEAEDPPESEEQARKTAERIAMANAEMARGAEYARAPDAKAKAAEAARIAGTPVGFAVQVLGLALYVWQAIVLSWFENTLEMVKGSLCTPNGAGKSERIVATLALWWITVHPQGRSSSRRKIRSSSTTRFGRRSSGTKGNSPATISLSGWSATGRAASSSGSRPTTRAGPRAGTRSTITSGRC